MLSLSTKIVRTVSCTSRLARLPGRAELSLVAPAVSSRMLCQRYYHAQQALATGGFRGSSPNRAPSASTSLSPSSTSVSAPLSEFYPPVQKSTINTHYCREPQLVMVEGYGILQGHMDSSRLLTKFLNIPFGTVHDLNEHAVAPESWEGIRDATVLGPMCPQAVQGSNDLSTMMLGLPGPGFEFSERDCLNLNIFAPRLCRDIPVICYIHGGSNQGGNALPKNDATNIVKQSIAKETPVVVVTVNYRLLPSAGLIEAPKEDPQGGEREGEKVNWGLYDQKLALEWIRKHIHNFGGNRNEITLMGHSNGASSAGYHLLTAQNEGLFKRAIMHSESRNANGSKRAGPRSEERGQLSESKSESKATASQLSSVVYESVGECSMGPAAQFTFMSDACTPYMSESEKQLGIQVIDRWIDFAWGKSGKPDGEV